MKIAHAECVISPEVGTLVAGYAPRDVSVRIHDDLKLSVLLMDDGERKGALLGFDLLGLDEEFTLKIAADAGKIIGCPPENVIITCTHTHSGPHTRSLCRVPADRDYIAALYEKSAAAVREASGSWLEVDTYFYSCVCGENYNRRYADGSNRGKYLPYHRSLEPLASGFRDRELGMLIFTAPGEPHPLGTVINYAAHPLATHAMGLGSHQISADFPGMLRDIMADNSCWCVFAQGAAGDMFPRDAECGLEAARRFADNLAIAAMRGFCDAIRNPELYLMKSPKIRTSVEKVKIHVRQDLAETRKELPALAGKKEAETRVHLFALGDVCLVGVPGELLAELGQEMKWHSPFRRTFILYNSTGYLSYICHANAFVAGGYETNSSHIRPYDGFQIVAAAVEGMRKLHEPFPEERDA